MDEEAIKRSEDYAGFIKVLYAVVIGRGLFDLAQNLGLPIKYENFVSWGFWLFVGALFITMRDWNTYYSSLRKRPHKNVARFVLDILILVCFFFLLRIAASQPDLSDEEVRAYAIICAVYFLILSAWEVTASVEYRDQAENAAAARNEIWWDTFFFGLFTAAAIVTWWYPMEWILIVVLIVFAIVSIRWKKDF